MSDYNNGYDEGYRAGMQKMREAGQRRIEELELAVRYEADLAQQALDAREELEAKLAKVVSFTSDAAYRATTIEHDRDEMWLLDLDVLRHERDCDITQARAALAELKGQ